MDHAVHYRTSAGDTRLEEVASLDDAVSLVERLRNDEGVSDVRVYRQVPIEFKAYYKVSVLGEGTSNGETANVAPAAPTATPAAPSQPSAQPSATAAPQAPQTPPPGAMPLGPSTPSAQPSAQPSVQAEEPGGDEGDGAKRGSLFSRG